MSFLHSDLNLKHAISLVMFILHYAPDNASLIIRLALEECGAPYGTSLVERSTQAQRSAAYLALNPNGLIPALQTPHGPMFETGAILLWLSDQYDGLFPPVADPTRGDALKWLFFVSNTLHPSMRALFYPEKYTTGDTSNVVAQMQVNIAAHLKVLETSVDWPQAPLVTKFYVAACLRWCTLYGPEDRSWFALDTYPALRDMLSKLEDRPCVQAAITAEGLGAHPFTKPCYPNPPEGSAL
ncbi:MAG: glutathione S-transferase family protein [Aliishimia sp.]